MATCPLPSWRASLPHLPGSLHSLPQAKVEQGNDQHQAGRELPAGGTQVADALALVEVQHAAPGEEGDGGPGGLPPFPELDQGVALVQRPALPHSAWQQGPGLMGLETPTPRPPPQKGQDSSLGGDAGPTLQVSRAGGPPHAGSPQKPSPGPGPHCQEKVDCDNLKT